MVSIDAFQALDPGSIPGHRILLDQISLLIYNSINANNLQTKVINKYFA